MGRYDDGYPSDDDEEESWEDDADDDLDDADDDDLDDDDDHTMPCPHCGADIYEDAVRCPVCERYLTQEEIRTTSKPRWVIVTAAVVLGAMVFAYLRYVQ